MDKKIRELEEILMSSGIKINYSRWDGSYKQFTKDCKVCGYYKRIVGEDICLVGEAWKRLIRVDKPQKCQYHQVSEPAN